MTFLDILIYRILAPGVIGFILFVILHWTVGLIANLDADEDEDKLTKWKYYYMVGIWRAKDVLFAWAIGVIVLMLVGII